MAEYTYSDMHGNQHTVQPDLRTSTEKVDARLIFLEAQVAILGAAIRRLEALLEGCRTALPLNQEEGK
jgi:hypothetical protein